MVKRQRKISSRKGLRANTSRATAPGFCPRRSEHLCRQRTHEPDAHRESGSSCLESQAARQNVAPIAAIFTHMHNVRTKWVRLTAPHLKIPRQLDRARCTPRQARAGLAESAARCEEMLAEALANDSSRIKTFFVTVGPAPGQSVQKCSATCSPTKPTIAARSACSPTSSVSPSRGKSPPAFGTGKTY